MWSWQSIKLLWFLFPWSVFSILLLQSLSLNLKYICRQYSAEIHSDNLSCKSQPSLRTKAPRLLQCTQKTTLFLMHTENHLKRNNSLYFKVVSTTHHSTCNQFNFLFIWEDVQVKVSLWSQDNLTESAPSSHLVDSGAQTQVIWFVRRHLYQLSHLHGLRISFFLK